MIELRGIGLALAAATCVWAWPGHSGAAQGITSSDGEQRLVARVNGEAITQAQLRQVLASASERQKLLREARIEDPEDADLERIAMRKLIHQRLILQEAQRRNFTVTERELGDATVSLRRRFGNIESMGSWMKDEGLDDHSLFEAIRSDLLATRVRRALVEKVRLDGTEVRRYEEAHRGELKTEEVWLQIIAVEERSRADEILAALRRGEDFGALARRHSIGKRAKQGGDMGWMNAHTLGPPLRDAVRLMQEGEARGPLARGKELLIVRLEARRSSAMTPPAARREIERRLLPAAQQRAIESWLAEQEKQARIEVPPRDRVVAAER